jgi:uncharacterized protein YhaN
MCPLHEEVKRLEEDVERARRAFGRQGEAPLPISTFPLPAMLAALGGLGCAAASAAWVFGGKGLMVALPLAAGFGVLLVWLQRRSARQHARSLDTQAAARREADAELKCLEDRLCSRRKALGEAAAAAGLSPSAEAEVVFARAEALKEASNQDERKAALALELKSASASLEAWIAKERSAQDDHTAALARVAELERVKDALAAEKGLPQGLSADRTLDVWGQAAQVQRLLFELSVEAKGLEADAHALEGAGEELLHVCRRLGLEGRTPPEALSKARVLLEERACQERERDGLRARHALAGSSLHQCQEAARQANARLEALYAEVECADEAALREKANQAGLTEQARASVREKEMTLEAIAQASVASVRQSVKAWGGAQGVLRALAQCEAKAGTGLSRRAELLDERGRLKQQLLAWETDAEASSLREKEAQLSARIERAAADYAADRIAYVLLSRARRAYQEAHQPRVLKMASGILAELTDGKYVRVEAQEDGRELCVRDQAGQEKSAEHLSRGTREQLYLAFRLAVVEDFGQRLGPLPLILDDILVNFDRERALNTLSVLAKVAQGHQVLAFTCHGWLKEAFASQGAHLVELLPPAQTLLRLRVG